MVLAFTGAQQVQRDWNRWRVFINVMIILNSHSTRFQIQSETCTMLAKTQWVCYTAHYWCHKQPLKLGICLYNNAHSQNPHI